MESKIVVIFVKNMNLKKQMFHFFGFEETQDKAVEWAVRVGEVESRLVRR